MTEDEAKTKWCPMRRAESSGFDKVFGPMPSNGSAKCIGSACMMWRSVLLVPQKGITDGYCGLAGKP